MTGQKRWYLLRWIATNMPKAFFLALADAFEEWDQDEGTGRP